MNLSPYILRYCICCLTYNILPFLHTQIVHHQNFMLFLYFVKTNKNGFAFNTLYDLNKLNNTINQQQDHFAQK